MRLPTGLQTAEATPQPANGADGGDDGALVDSAEGAWDRVVDVLEWLGGISLNLLWAAIVVVAIVYVSGRFRRRARAVLERRVGERNNLPALLDNVFQIIVYVIAVAFALGALGTDANALVSTIGLLTAAVTFSLQDVLKNFVAGLYLLAEQPFAPGDRLEVSGQVGTVEEINVRTTVLRNDRAEQVLVPNYQVFSQVVSNRSAYRRRAVTIQVAGIPGDPEAALAEAADWLEGVAGLADDPPLIELTKVGPDGYELAVTIWAAPGQDPRREAVQRLRARFPEATVAVVP